MRTVLGIRVGLALFGWGIVIGGAIGGLVALVLLPAAAGELPTVSGDSGTFGLIGASFGAFIGGAVGAVGGCPAAVVAAAMARKKPEDAAGSALLAFMVLAIIGGLVALLLSAGLLVFIVVPALLIAGGRVYRTVRLNVAHPWFASARF